MLLSSEDRLEKFLRASILALIVAPVQGIAQETSAAQIPTSFRWYYSFPPGGWRNWFRADAQTWIERYDTGQESKFYLLAPSAVNGCNGIVLIKDDNSIQAFIPNDRCPQQVALFQPLAQRGGNWCALGDMRDASYQFQTPYQLQIVGNDPWVGPICAGPLGPGPCVAVQLYLLRLSGQLPSPTFNLEQLQVINNGVPGVGPICNGPLGAGPCALVQQYILDHSTQTSVAPPPTISDGGPQRLAIECARRAGLNTAGFASCAGQQVILSENQHAVLNCAVSPSTAQAFAECAAPQLGIRLSDKQRQIAGCAMKSRGDTSNFLSCAGSTAIGRNLTPDEQAVLYCAQNSNDSASNFASCSATRLIGGHVSKEQKLAVECAAQSEGDYSTMASCAGANLFNLNLNPEQQIAIQCVVSTGGQPYAAAGCIATRLTGRELVKCATNGFGGTDGCFGDNNDLFGRNGWTARTLDQIAGGPNSVFRHPDQLWGGPNSFVRNPSQIWGGDNSFLRNPSQIWGGDNSFVRNPSQFWGGNNSVFNNPSQLAPKPVTLAEVGGKRICLPWC
jgi:hypothetical protein